MKNVFIDSNIWLSLYHFTNDDLEQFGKLKELNGRNVQLFIPQQVYDEVVRNRESRLKESLNQFKMVNIKFPAFCKGYDEYKIVSGQYKELTNRMKRWVERINEDITEKRLSADRIIRDIFNSNSLLDCEQLIEKAYSRYKIGNPPGKKDKYGDAINWECLLKFVPDNEDLYLISSDKDYCSVIDGDRINPFLEDEWRQKKNSNIHLYTNLVSFLNSHIQEIQLKAEREKQELIEKLKESYNFTQTHGVIAMLNKYNEWTEGQIDEICDAAENNTQVKWILEDADVYDFYDRLLSRVNCDKLSDCATKRIYSFIQNMGKSSLNFSTDEGEINEYQGED